MVKFFSRSVLGLLLLPLAVCAQETRLELTLAKAIEIAIDQNPTIRVADKAIELKKVADEEAWQTLLPSADLSGTFNHNFKIQTIVMGGQTFKMGTENNANGGIQISLPVFAPSVYKMMKMTKDDILLAREQARSSRLDLVNQVTKAYFQLMLSQDSFEVLKKALKQAEDNFDIVNAKFNQGLVSEYDRLTAEVQKRNVMPSVVSAENAVRLAKLQLKVLMGVTAEVDVVADDKLDNYEDVLSQPIPEIGDLSSSSNLRQLDMNSKLLQHALKINKAAYLPTVGFAFSWAYTSMAQDWRIMHYKWNPYVYGALQVSIPLYHASTSTKIKSTKLQIAQLADNRLNAERQIRMQATSYQNNMLASSAQVESNKKAVSQAQKARDISEKRYQIGNGTMLELNSSEVALTQAQLTYCQSIYDYLASKADLEHVLGNGEY